MTKYLIKTIVDFKEEIKNLRTSYLKILKKYLGFHSRQIAWERGAIWAQAGLRLIVGSRQQPKS